MLVLLSLLAFTSPFLPFAIAIELFNDAIAQAEVQSDLLRETPSPPPKIHWHKIRHHSSHVTESEERSQEPIFNLERELFIKSAEIKPLYEETGDLEMHPQLRDKQHYGPVGPREYNGYDEDEYPVYSPKFTLDIFDPTPMSDTAKCFSCMSKFYEAVWPILGNVYKRPRNFTDKCNDEQFDPDSVPVSHCSTICVQMWEEPTVAGVKIRGHIRGCLDDILHRGFNQSIVAWYRWLHRDSCNQYRKRDLLMLPPDQSDDSYVHVCACYSDHCNVSAAPGVSWSLVLLVTIAAFLHRHRLP